MDRFLDGTVSCPKTLAECENLLSNGWKPIETAPMEYGKRVLLLSHKYGAGSGHFDERWHMHFVLPTIRDQPDMWQPLPPPPTQMENDMEDAPRRKKPQAQEE